MRHERNEDVLALLASRIDDRGDSRMGISGLLEAKAAHDLAMDDLIVQCALGSIVVQQYAQNLQEDQKTLAMQTTAVAQTLCLRATGSLLQEVIQLGFRLSDGVFDKRKEGHAISEKRATGGLVSE